MRHKWAVIIIISRFVIFLFSGTVPLCNNSLEFKPGLLLLEAQIFCAKQFCLSYLHRRIICAPENIVQSINAEKPRKQREREREREEALPDASTLYIQKCTLQQPTAIIMPLNCRQFNPRHFNSNNKTYSLPKIPYNFTVAREYRSLSDGRLTGMWQEYDRLHKRSDLWRHRGELQSASLKKLSHRCVFK